MLGTNAPISEKEIERVRSERTGHWLSKEQMALEKVALAFYDKHEYVQYDQYRLLDCTSGDPLIVYDTRRECYATPEVASAERITHLDCSSFVWAIYQNAFGDAADLFAPKTLWMESFVKKALEEGEVAADAPVVYCKYLPEQERRSEDHQRIISDLRAILQPGDLILFRRWNEEKKKNGGHVVMYLDGDWTIEVRGGSYDYATGKDSIEKGGAILFYPLDELLFSPEAGTRYLFGRKGVYCVAVMRPLNMGARRLTTDAQARLALGRLSVTKTAIPVGQMVTPGEEITFTIRLNNAPDKGGKSKDLLLTVTDPVPGNTVFVSAEGGELDGDTITFRDIALCDGEVKELHYTVKVCAESGAVVSGSGSVNGLSFRYHDIPIGKGLTPEQEGAFLRRAEEGKPKESTALAWLNEICRSTLGKDLGTDSVEELFGAVYAPCADKDGAARFCVAPDLTSPVCSAWMSSVVIGRYVLNLTDEEYTQRVRYLREESLRPGDILAIYDGEDAFFYLYCGSGKALLKVSDELVESVDTASALESILMHRLCLLLRPSRMCG